MITDETATELGGETAADEEDGSGSRRVRRAAAGIAARARPLERARGVVHITIRRKEGRDAVADLRQEGCGRALFPARSTGSPVEAVIVNTAGGVTGGDRFNVAVSVGSAARAVISTQACEKVYRSSGGAAKVTTRIKAAAGASLLWLPQETILFEGSILQRRLDADIAEDSVFLAVEAVILGRAAMGETLSSSIFRDSWRVRRGGRLVFAEAAACDGAWERAFAGKAALGAGTAALATMLLAAPDADDHLAPCRAVMTRHGIDGGVSLVDGLLVVRLVAGAGLALREALLPLLHELSGGPLPRVWQT